MAVPLVLAALAGLSAERSGIVDIGLEGKMLAAAFAAAAAATVTGSAWLGLGAGIGVAVRWRWSMRLASVRYNGNQVVSGMAINILIAGLRPPWQCLVPSGRADTAAERERALWPTSPCPSPRHRPIPIIGPLYTEVISGHNVLVYVAAPPSPSPGG